jgi:hypothetical protein
MKRRPWRRRSRAGHARRQPDRPEAKAPMMDARKGSKKSGIKNENRRALNKTIICGLWQKFKKNSKYGTEVNQKM